MSDKLEQVFAIHDFEREHEDEITFYAGEPIIVIEKDEKYLDGWWQGRNQRGQVGLFPMNYTSSTKPSRMDGTFEEEQHDGVTVTTTTATVSTIATKTSSSVTSRSSILSSPPEMSVHDQDQGQDKSTHSSPPIALSDSNPESWDVPRVCTWLESVGLESAIDIFIEQEITGDVLLDLNMDTLKELGITAYGRRYKIMTAISKLIATHQQEQKNPSYSEKGPVPKVSISTGHDPSFDHNHDHNHDHYTPSITSSNDNTYYPSRPSNHIRSTLSSPIDADSLYQFPRKAPPPPSSTVSSSILHENSVHRPISSTSTSLSSGIHTNSNTVSRSNTYNTTSSSSGTIKSSDYSTRSGAKAQKENSRDAAHPSVSLSAPTKSIHQNINSNSDRFQQEISARINHPADQKLSMASIDSAVQRVSTDEFRAPEHEGWLHKQSDKYKTWNKRWFVLKGTNLFYFKSPKDVRMKGIINLRGYRVIVDETIHSNKYCFKTQHEQERTFFFYTDTKESMKLWLQALMKATIMPPVMSSNQVATVPLDVAQRMRPRPPSVIMYKAPPATNEPMKMVAEEEEDHYSTESNRLDATGPALEDDSDYHITPLSTMDTPAISNNDDDDDDDDDDDSDEDNIDPYQTAQRHHQQLQMNGMDAIRKKTPSPLMMMQPMEAITKPERTWTNTQYVKWINTYLPEGKKAVDLSGAFRNGDTLIVLLETLSGKTVRRNPEQKGGSVSMKVLDNIVAAFKFMGREGVVVDGRYTIKDIFGGHEDKILDMVDAIKMWADVNGYTDQNVSNKEHTTALSPPPPPPPPASHQTLPSSPLTMTLLPETPTDHDDFSKSFYNDTMHHLADSTQHHPQHVA